MSSKRAGNRLMHVLRSRGINQSRLAEQAGTTAATISRIISGKLGLTVKLAERISQVTGFRAGWLLTGEPPTASNEKLAATIRSTYLAGWRDAMAAVNLALTGVEEPLPDQSALSSPEPPASLDAVKRHRQELVDLGRVEPLGRPPVRRRKPA